MKPDIAVSTPEAYARVTPATPKISLKEIIKRPLAEWRDVMINDFERSVFPSHPEIGHIKEALYGEGAIYAAMSGSGSSVFGLFDAPTRLKEKALLPDCFVWEGEL